MSDPMWIKAAMSAGTNACVEMAAIDGFIALRDSKNPSVQLRFSYAEIEAFLDGVRRNEFDHILDAERAHADPP